MRKLDAINLFLAGAAVCLITLYAGTVLQKAWLQAQQDAAAQAVTY